MDINIDPSVRLNQLRMWISKERTDILKEWLRDYQLSSFPPHKEYAREIQEEIDRRD